MFKKPLRIKSNNQVKGSERKGIKNLFCKHFSNIPEAEANNIFNNKKDPLNCIKLVTYDNEVLQVYCIQKLPMFFSLREKLFPTIFLLWKIPNLLPSFTTHPHVMNFISSGADLMLPGVLTPPAQSCLPKYNNVSEGSPVFINLSNNRAAVAVGIACQSSYDMERFNGKGKCVTVYHFYGDHLCILDGISNPPLPYLKPPDWLVMKSYDSDFPGLPGFKPESKSSENEDTNKDNAIDVADSVIMNKCDDGDNTNNEVDNEQAKGEGSGGMDELLFYSFLSAIKYSKTLNLPVLISNFFKLQMLPMCPPGSTLDIKRSSYRKLKPFLDEMCKIGLITVKEIKKGVEAITNINKDHAKYSEFYLKPEDRPKKDSNEVIEAKQTFVTESYIVTQNVLPIFQPAGYQKGDVIEGSVIRKFVTEYVKQNECQDTRNTKLVKPATNTLKTICKTENYVTWEDVIEKVCESMKNCFKVTSGNDQILNKGKVSPITMNISLRSGNKKVTIVDNLEVFGINISEFSKECQHGVAASTSITSKPPGKKCDQLLVQGNQILFIYNLLIEKYKVPKKYIMGLEKAPKKRK